MSSYLYEDDGDEPRGDVCLEEDGKMMTRCRLFFLMISFLRQDHPNVFSKSPCLSFSFVDQDGRAGAPALRFSSETKKKKQETVRLRGLTSAAPSLLSPHNKRDTTIRGCCREPSTPKGMDGHELRSSA